MSSHSTYEISDADASTPYCKEDLLKTIGRLSSQLGLDQLLDSSHKLEIKSNSRRRQCMTDTSSIIVKQDLHSHFTVDISKPCSQSNAALSKNISNDVAGSQKLLPHVSEESHSDSNVQNSGQINHPAQAEWEQLWYHGVSAAFQKVAHYFPTISISRKSIVEQSISEPTLEVKDLKEDEQAVFQVDKTPQLEPFAPRSQQEIQDRLAASSSLTDEQQIQAVLLGLPTFAEYLDRKQTSKPVERDPLQPSKRSLKKQAKFAEKKQAKAVQVTRESPTAQFQDEGYHSSTSVTEEVHISITTSCMTQNGESSSTLPIGGASHRPLVVGLTKPPTNRTASTMASSSATAAVEKEMTENVKDNTSEAAPTQDVASSSQKPKKEKAPKQPKPQKTAAPSAPTTPALIDLRVGHILRAIAHPNADSLYVSTIAMGDPEGTDFTEVDEETGKVVRTVCSGLNGLVPLEEMQNRKIIVVANLKPVNMRSIKSAAMVLAASPKAPEGADPHSPDRVVELVSPPENAEAGDKVYFEGWPYGEGKGPEKTLNPKKKQWEAIQPGFYTGDDLVVGFDAGQCEEVEGSEKGRLVVEGKGPCTVKTLKGAVVK